MTKEKANAFEMNIEEDQYDQYEVNQISASEESMPAPEQLVIEQSSTTSSNSPSSVGTSKSRHL